MIPREVSQHRSYTKLQEVWHPILEILTLMEVQGVTEKLTSRLGHKIRLKPIFLEYTKFACRKIVMFSGTRNETTNFIKS